jgi:PTH1 family peptidyl-tRNA hydrolase
MYYVVGLGNPGEEYRMSRHNVGWHVLDVLGVSNNFPNPITNKKFSGRVTTAAVGGEMVTMLYPETFMNHSGSAVAKLVPAVEVSRLIVVHDDIDVPFGVVRIAFGRGSGGHNGVASIVSSLGTKQFVRVRVGIGKVGFWPWEDKQMVRRPQGAALPAYVLGNFSAYEQSKLDAVCTQAAGVIIDCITQGYVKAMNIHNQAKKSERR